MVTPEDGKYSILKINSEQLTNSYQKNLKQIDEELKVCKETIKELLDIIEKFGEML